VKFAGRLIVILAALSSTYAVAQERSEGKTSGPSVAAAEKAAPTLTTEQKQAIQIQAQRIEIAQLRAQAAQAEFDKARTEIAALVQSLQKEGFDLDLQTLSYTPKKAEPKK